MWCGIAVALLLGSSSLAGSSLWSSSAGPANPWGNDAPVTLGVKFRSDVSGAVTGVRFYKGAGNNGTHIALLYSSAGTLLAQATFSGETASGWQQVDFPGVPILPNATYIAAVFSTSGYSRTANYFTSAGADNPPLHALRSGMDGPNGVYAYGAAPKFPSLSSAANYWVDVVFSASALVSGLSVACKSGTVGFAALTATGITQDIVLIPAVADTFRILHVTLRGIERFIAGGWPVSASFEPSLTGLIALYDTVPWHWTDRPDWPLAGTYDIVLRFSQMGALVNSVTAGSVAWEVCGFDTAPSAILSPPAQALVACAVPSTIPEDRDIGIDPRGNRVGLHRWTVDTPLEDARVCYGYVYPAKLPVLDGAGQPAVLDYWRWESQCHRPSDPPGQCVVL